MNQILQTPTEAVDEWIEEHAPPSIKLAWRIHRKEQAGGLEMLAALATVRKVAEKLP